MDRSEFEKLFRSSLSDAVKRGAPELRTMPKRLRVELHGAGHGGIAMSVEEAASILYLGPDAIHRVIDVGLLGADQDEGRLFVRPSDLPPGRWDQTVDPSGTGPFKFLGRRT
jgi:hypothetical protein